MSLIKKHIVLVIVGLSARIACKAQFDYAAVPTNSNWHTLNTNALTSDFENQIMRSVPTNSVVFFRSFQNGWAWTTNAEELWRGVWVEDTNRIRTQLTIVNNTTNCLVRIQVGSFTLKRELGSQCFKTPNGKFSKFELADSSRRIVPPKPNAGTNLFDPLGVYFRPNPPAWAEPSAASLVADFPEKVSTSTWPLYYQGVGRAPTAPLSLSGQGIAEQISALNLYDLYSITNAGEYTLTVQPVLYLQKSGASEFLDRVDFPSVTTKVHLVPNIK